MKAVIYGAGNIGRGFIGQLTSQSGFETVFLDINNEVIDRLNADKKYPVTIVSDDGNREIIVENVRGVNSRNEEDAVTEMISADVMATSVGVNVLKFIAKPIAKAVEKRILEKKAPLNILLCENLIDANHYLKEQIFLYLSESSKSVFSQYVGLVEASIGRMVPVLPRVEGDNPLRVSVEEFDILHLDRDGFVGEIPKIKNILPYSPFNYFIQRKLFIHNMCHAATAYLGAIEGYDTISEAISDSDIKYIVNMAGTASARAIALDNKQEAGALLDFLYKLLFRFNNSALQDTIERVGRDPVRKLKKIDRLAGAYILCKKHGLHTEYICTAIAAALCYKNPADASSLSVQKSITDIGVAATLRKLSEYEGFESKDMELITLLYGILKAGNIREAIAICEKIQANSITNL